MVLDGCTHIRRSCSRGLALSRCVNVPGPDQEIVAIFRCTQQGGGYAWSGVIHSLHPVLAIDILSHTLILPCRVLVSALNSCRLQSAVRHLTQCFSRRSRL